MQPQIIGIRFNKLGKIYHFDTSDLPDVSVGDYVIVETSRGDHIGEIMQIVEEELPVPKGGWKKVIRRANTRDLILAETW